MATLDPFASRNTLFTARVKNAGSKSPENQSRALSPKKKKSFNENASYACIANPKNNSIYISEATFSGKLLNSQNLSKENLSNRYLFPESSENYPFDKVFNENCEYSFRYCHFLIHKSQTKRLLSRNDQTSFKLCTFWNQFLHCYIWSFQVISSINEFVYILNLDQASHLL